jgi:hypothetical protein
MVETVSTCSVRAAGKLLGMRQHKALDSGKFFRTLFSFQQLTGTARNLGQDATATLSSEHTKGTCPAASALLGKRLHFIPAL